MLMYDSRKNLNFYDKIKIRLKQIIRIKLIIFDGILLLSTKF